MRFNREVPQFIDIEDKIAFQLTAKQLGWAGLGAFFGFLAWIFLEEIYFIISAIIIAVITGCFMFIKPYGQTLFLFLSNAFMFGFKPKVYIWRRGYQNPEEKIVKKIEKEKNQQIKKIDIRDVKKAIKELKVYD